MKLIKHILNTLFSNKLSGLLLLLFAFAMATATFIENDYNTETAKALVYGAKWFEILILFLAINFIGNIVKYDLLSWKKAPILLFHLAFIIIILGAGITRYRGFEALLTIKENETKNEIISMDSYFQIHTNSGKTTENFISKPLLMTELGSNRFSKKIKIDTSEVSITLKEYIPRAKFILEDSISGKTHLHLVISNDDKERKNFYIEQGTRETVHNTTISFESTNPLKGDIIILKHKNQWMVKFPKTTDYFSMLLNKAGSYAKDSLAPLKLKTLFNINGTSVAFNEIKENTKKKLISDIRNPDKKNPESAVLLEVTTKNKKKEIILFGGKGYVNPFSSLFIDGIHLNLRYGSKILNLPFSLHLYDFILERYPGSDSPSAFYSKLAVQDKNKLFHRTIFMNNVLNYKGYRFFQSAYTPDEQGTILSINHDYWGTLVTYIGYSMLGLGMFLTLFWKNSHFGTILTFLKQKN